jgi:hypothetical protein
MRNGYAYANVCKKNCLDADLRVKEIAAGSRPAETAVAATASGPAPAQQAWPHRDKPLAAIPYSRLRHGES